jgi:dolichol-phosphate mannosyltransferase
MISLVIPVLNEAPSLPQLYQEICQVAVEQAWQIEIIFIDDGSSDESWSEITALSRQDSRVHGLRFRRNFGKAAAIHAGVQRSRGEWIAMLDADLQDDPRELAKLWQQLNQDSLDLVTGWKRQRHDPWHKRWPSWLFNRAINFLTGMSLHDHNCGIKLGSRELFSSLVLYGDRHRFITVMSAALGFRVGEVAVQHRPRVHGYSKYGWSRLPKGLLDLVTISFLTSFNQRPQHLLGLLGGGAFGLGILGLVYLAVYWVVRMIWFTDLENWPPVHQRPLVIYCLGALLLGAQLLCLGFLAELIVQRTADRGTPYQIREQTPPAGE